MRLIGFLSLVLIILGLILYLGYTEVSGAVFVLASDALNSKLPQSTSMAFSDKKLAESLPSAGSEGTKKVGDDNRASVRVARELPAKVEVGPAGGIDIPAGQLFADNRISSYYYDSELISGWSALTLVMASAVFIIMGYTVLRYSPFV